MTAVVEHARAGGAVLGICNGFQVLCEAGLQCLSRPVDARVQRPDTPFTCASAAGTILTVPTAHGEGRYVATEDTLRAPEAEGRAILRYVGDNPTGSVADIAGIASAGAPWSE